jgi:hypothetical protein
MINATLAKRAKKLGVALTETESDDPNKKYAVTWKAGRYELFGGEPKYLLDDAQAIITMDTQYQSFDWDIMDDDTISIQVRGTDIEVNGLRASAAFAKAKEMWMESRSTLDVEDEESDEEAQAEVDAEIEEEEGAKKGGVVAPKYRARYAEAGHPTNCGDWLAEVLANLTLNKAGSNIELFEKIASHNSVDLSRYKHDGNGWQGRLRMTGRNLMAKHVFKEGGLIIPGDLGVGEPHGDNAILRAPQEWLASQRFKKEG